MSRYMFISHTVPSSTLLLFWAIQPVFFQNTHTHAQHMHIHTHDIPCSPAVSLAVHFHASLWPELSLPLGCSATLTLECLQNYQSPLTAQRSIQKIFHLGSVKVNTHTQMQGCLKKNKSSPSLRPVANNYYNIY